ncbi:MAG: hypothetical protein ACK41P_00370 [Asticcacaulis sp.]
MSNHALRKLALLAVCSGLAFVPAHANADGAREIQVAGRTLTFLEGGPSGRVVFAVVFDPSKPASVAEKDQIMGALGSGMAAGGATVVGKAVEAGDVAGTSGVGAFYLTRGVNFASAGAAAKSKKVLVISSDMACVKSGACVMGVSASPKVEIVVNSASAAAVGVKFKAAFKMMIKEI